VKKRVFVAVLLAVLFFVGSVGARADSWYPPHRFEIWSDDGEYMFRFSPDEALLTWTSAHGYAQAAVYRGGREPELIYTVENLRAWAYSGNFFFAADMRHFAFMPSPHHHFDFVGVMFYSHGRLVRSYYIEDLVEDISQANYFHPIVGWLGAYPEVFPQYNILAVTTFEGVRHLFDIETGDILQPDTLPESAVPTDQRESLIPPRLWWPEYDEDISEWLAENVAYDSRNRKRAAWWALPYHDQHKPPPT